MPVAAQAPTNTAQAPQAATPARGAAPPAGGAAHPAQGKTYLAGRAAVRPGAAADAPSDGGTYKVKPGDTLSAIAGQVLGNPGQWRQLWQANLDALPNPNLLRPGQELKVPAAPAAAPAPSSGAGAGGAGAGGTEAGGTEAGGAGGAAPAAAAPAAAAPDAPAPAAAAPVAAPIAGDGPVPLYSNDKAPEPAAAAATAPATSAAPQTYTVKGGDTLVAIAGQILGDPNLWTRLWQANRAVVASPHDIQPGMVLQIPRDGATLPARAPAPVAPARGGGADAAATGPKGTTPGTDGKKDAPGSTAATTKADDASMKPDGTPASGRGPLEAAMANLYNSKGKFITSEAGRLGIETGVAAACLMCESGGAGFVNGVLKIRFEPGVFKGYTGQRVADDHASQASEYAAFAQAQTLDKAMAYESISMGAAQIMGFNATNCGYGGAVDMYEDFKKSERAQVGGFFSFVGANRVLLNAAKQKDWATFALHYNGPGYKSNAYDTKLAQYYDAWQAVTSRLKT